MKLRPNEPAKSFAINKHSSPRMKMYEIHVDNVMINEYNNCSKHLLSLFTPLKKNFSINVSVIFCNNVNYYFNGWNFKTIFTMEDNSATV